MEINPLERQRKRMASDEHFGNGNAIVHGIVKKRGFKVGNGIESFYVRMYVYMS